MPHTCFALRARVSATGSSARRLRSYPCAVTAAANGGRSGGSLAARRGVVMARTVGPPARRESAVGELALPAPPPSPAALATAGPVAARRPAGRARLAIHSMRVLCRFCSCSLALRAAAGSPVARFTFARGAVGLRLAIRRGRLKIASIIAPLWNVCVRAPLSAARCRGQRDRHRCAFARHAGEYAMDGIWRAARLQMTEGRCVANGLSAEM